MNMKTCVVVEGGALRGIYAAGVLDALYEENIKIDAMIGVSMGALVGINYLSKQPGRALRYNLKYCPNRNYIGVFSLLKTGDIANKQFAYYDLPLRLDPFDYDAFAKSKIKFYCTVTNLESGKAEYIEIKDPYKQIEYIRAGASMPAVSNIVKIKKKEYLDGGIADSIPVMKAIEMGYDKIIVILTRPLGYRKSPSKLKFLSWKYGKYPKFKKTLEKRNSHYNETLDIIKELESNKEIFVIRPSRKVPIKRIEHNPKMVQAQYDLGVEDFQEKKTELYGYLD